MVGGHFQIQGILGCNDIDLVPHQPPEKGNQMPFRAANLAHTADEYVELSQLFGAEKCYYGIMKALTKK